MKITHLTILFYLFLGSLPLQAQEISEEQKHFVNHFISVVEAHQLKATLKCTDKIYRKEQLRFLEGRKEQFVNELFGGMDLNTNSYVNTRFNDILKIEVAEIIPQEDGSFEYIFRIRDEKHDLLKSLLLRKTKNRFGFIGSMG